MSMPAGGLVSGAFGLMLIVALGACTSRPTEPAVRSTAPTTLPMPAATTTTTTTVGPIPSTATTPSTAIPGGCPSGIGVAAQSAAQAARCLHESWKDGDRARAAVYASLDVVDTLFQAAWSPPDGTFEGCSAASTIERQTCTFGYHGADYVLDVRRSEGGWRVTALPRPPRRA